MYRSIPKPKVFLHYYIPVVSMEGETMDSNKHVTRPTKVIGPKSSSDFQHSSSISKLLMERPERVQHRKNHRWKKRWVDIVQIFSWWRLWLLSTTKMHA